MVEGEVPSPSFFDRLPTLLLGVLLFSTKPKAESYLLDLVMFDEVWLI
jgi:hypothetical protein